MTATGCSLPSATMLARSVPVYRWNGTGAVSSNKKSDNNCVALL
jgi:hypothetical protein